MIKCIEISPYITVQGLVVCVWPNGGMITIRVNGQYFKGVAV